MGKNKNKDGQGGDETPEVQTVKLTPELEALLKKKASEDTDWEAAAVLLKGKLDEANRKLEAAGHPKGSVVISEKEQVDAYNAINGMVDGDLTKLAAALKGVEDVTAIPTLMADATKARAERRMDDVVKAFAAAGYDNAEVVKQLPGVLDHEYTVVTVKDKEDNDISSATVKVKQADGTFLVKPVGELVDGSYSMFKPLLKKEEGDGEEEETTTRTTRTVLPKKGDGKATSKKTKRKSYAAGILASGHAAHGKKADDK